MNIIGNADRYIFGGLMDLKGIKLTWLGHATFRVETPEGKMFYVDPWVGGNPMCPANEKKVKKADVLICTHGHGDHIGDAVEIGKQHDSIAVGIFELCSWLQKKGVKQIAPMNKGGTQTLASVKITMVHAVHSCGIQDGDQIIYGGEACGYVLEFSNGVKLYHAGDTNVFSDMAIIRDLYAPENCDAAHRRPLHHVTARGRLCLQTSQAGDCHPHAFRDISDVDRTSQPTTATGTRSEGDGDEAWANHFITCPDPQSAKVSTVP